MPDIEDGDSDDSVDIVLIEFSLLFDVLSKVLLRVSFKVRDIFT